MDKICKLGTMPKISTSHKLFYPVPIPKYHQYTPYGSSDNVFKMFSALNE